MNQFTLQDVQKTVVYKLIEEILVPCGYEPVIVDPNDDHAYITFFQKENHLPKDANDTTLNLYAEFFEIYYYEFNRCFYVEYPTVHFQLKEQKHTYYKDQIFLFTQGDISIDETTKQLMQIKNGIGAANKIFHTDLVEKHQCSKQDLNTIYNL